MCVLTCIRNLMGGVWNQNSYLNGRFYVCFFNRNPHFSTFWPEIWNVCSYLQKKPNGRCLESEFLLKWSLLTIFNGNPHFPTFLPEIWHVCSYLQKKPDSRGLGSKFLLKWLLLTVFNGFLLWLTLSRFYLLLIKTCALLLTCFVGTYRGYFTFCISLPPPPPPTPPGRRRVTS